MTARTWSERRINQFSRRERRRLLRHPCARRRQRAWVDAESIHLGTAFKRAAAGEPIFMRCPPAFAALLSAWGDTE